MALSAHTELPDAWHEIRAALRRAVGESTYEIWLAQVEPAECKGAVLRVSAPVDTGSWILGRFGRVIEQCASGVLGRPVRLELTTAAGRARRRGPAEAPGPELPTTFNPRHSFDQFVIGNGNRLAHAAALAAAELPGQAYNPLFLHAPPGLGKTHLLHAIGNYVLTFGGGTTVRYATVESFTNDFINAIATKSLGRFKHIYRDVDVLLIDDVQFLASKAKTEEEFFHTFNALYETGRQLVITCDRLPGELISVEERLRERFEAGLVADIQPPDFATRFAILRKRAVLDRVPLTDVSVLELIASRVKDNIRTLEGALIRTVAYQSLTRRPLDVELATTVLDTMYPHTKPRGPTVESIQKAVAAHFELTVSDLASPSRAARIVWPRQLAIHLVRELTHASLMDIGTAFGGRNHATIHYACTRVSERLARDPDASETLRDLLERLHEADTDRRS